MKHVKSLTQESLPATAQGTVCGYLFTPSFTKCVDADSPVAALLKTVPVP